MTTPSAWKRAAVLLVSAAMISACGSGETGRDDTSPSVDVASSAATTAATATASTATVATTRRSGVDPERPFEVIVPASYSAARPAPLVIVLHGYTASGASARRFFGLDEATEAKGVIAAYPDGTADANGARFWNATDACCNFGAAAVDDSAYLTDLIDDVERRYNIDPRRIYVIGHSNGGFMSYRMACEHSDRVSAIVSVAGAAPANESLCAQTNPVSVAQVHGTADAVISYSGGQIFGRTYPSARESVTALATRNGCTGPVELTPTARTIDADSTLDGSETTVETAAGCPAGVAVELWTIADGAHTPTLTAEFAAKVVEFLLAHPRPGP